ncbi:MAG: ABC transporter permease subunit [Clostridium sp.]
MNTFKVEVFKLVKSRKYIAFCMALMVIIGIKFYGIHVDAKNELPTIKLENNELLLIDYKAKVKDESIPENKLNEYRARIKVIEEENIELKEEIEQPNYNWKEKLVRKNENLNNKIKSDELAFRYNDVKKSKGEILTNEYLLSNNIEPQKAYKIEAFVDISKVIKFINILLLPMLIVIIACDTISGEMQNSTAKMFLTKPIKRGQVIISKFLALFLVCYITVVIIEIISFLIMGMLFDFGSAKYPMIVGTLYDIDRLKNISAIADSSYIITISEYLVKTILYQGITILPIIAVTLFISVKSISVSTSFILSGIITLVTSVITFITPIKFLKYIYPYFFITYSDGTQILEGVINSRLSTSNISLSLGIIVCTIWTVLFLILSYKRFNSIDIKV